MRRPGPGVGNSIFTFLHASGQGRGCQDREGGFSLLGHTIVLLIGHPVSGARCPASCFYQGVLWLGWNDAKGDRQETKQRNNGKGTKQNGDNGV